MQEIQSKSVLNLAIQLNELLNKHLDAAEAQTACSIAQSLAALRKESLARLRVGLSPSLEEKPYPHVDSEQTEAHLVDANVS